MPKVSVIIPTYNCEAFITEAVESVLTQTFQDFELIVIDDGSTDNTRQLLAPYQDRLIYHYQENQGESVARNWGIQIAQGDYIAFLDSDDLWLPPKLERQVPQMESHPEAVLVYSYCYAIDASGERIAFRGSDRMGAGETGLNYDVFRRLALDNFIANPGTVIVRKKYLQNTAPFDPAIQWGEDWDLWLRLSLRGPFIFVPEVLACYRMRKPGRRLQIEASDDFVQQNEIFLRRVFNNLPPERTDLQQLEPKAFARLYFRSAIHNFELADARRGAGYLNKLSQIDSTFINNGLTFAQRIAHEAFRIAATRNDLDAGPNFVGRVFDHLPLSMQGLQRYRSRALSEFNMAAAFLHYKQGERTATLRHVLSAIRQQPGNLSNRGLLSIGLQALRGGKRWTENNEASP